MDSSAFTYLPAEIRINVYRHIAASNARMSSFQGLLASNHQINDEMKAEISKGYDVFVKDMQAHFDADTVSPGMTILMPTSFKLLRCVTLTQPMYINRATMLTAPSSDIVRHLLKMHLDELVVNLQVAWPVPQHRTAEVEAVAFWLRDVFLQPVKDGEARVRRIVIDTSFNYRGATTVWEMTHQQLQPLLLEQSVFRALKLWLEHFLFDKDPFRPRPQLYKVEISHALLPGRRPFVLDWAGSHWG
jgi:hypothetical protein